MINVIVGLDVLRRPARGSPPHVFDEYIVALDGVYELTKRACINVAVTEHALPILTEAEGVPPLVPGEMAHLHSGDVAKLFYGFLQRARSLEEASGVREVLADGVRLTPDHASHGMQRSLRIQYERCLQIAAILRQLELSFASPVVLLGFGPRSVTVTIEGTVEDVEWSKGDPAAALPLRLEAHVPCASLPKHICEITDAKVVAQGGFIRDAIDIEIARERIIDNENHPSWPFTNEPYRIHDSFVQNVYDLARSADPAFWKRLLRACAETVLFRNMAAVHELRVTQSGGSPQRVRPKDGAVARRRDIDHDYHLHYWQIGKTIEFAAAGTHNDFKIPE